MANVDDDNRQHVFCPRPKEMAVLKDAYEAVLGNKPNPQVVALVAESGLGKTRLVQEFYNWLSTEKDGIGESGYWPDSLSRTGDNLQIDPDPEKCHANIDPPFLWSGLRLQDRGERNKAVSLSVLHTCAERFKTHLERAFLAERIAGSKENTLRILRNLLIEGGAEVLSSTIPGLGLLRAIRAAAFEYARVREHSDDDRALTPAEARNTNLRDLAKEYLSYVKVFFQHHNRYSRPVPFVFVVDDAQWADSDPALLDFVDNLLAMARVEHWPLLVVVTIWEKEWNDKVAIRKVIERHVHSDWRPVTLENHPNLLPCITNAFPGLAAEQASLIAEKAGGNPLLLDQILRELRDNPRSFEDRNSERALTVEALEKVRKEKYDLHTLVKRRMNAFPEIKTTLALSGIQGTRFLIGLSQELLTMLNDQWTANEAVAIAEYPLAFVKRSGELAEFSQRIFYEVALESLPDVANAAKVREALAFALVARLLPTFTNVPRTDFEDLLLIGSAVLAGDPDSDRRQISAQALIGLTTLARRRFDNRAALSFASQFQQGLLDGRWHLESSWLTDLQTVLSVFEDNLQSEVVCTFATSLVQFVKSLDDNETRIECQQLLSGALLTIGDIELEKNKPIQAAELYHDALNIERNLHKQHGIEKANHLSRSLVSYADVASNYDSNILSRSVYYNEALEIDRNLFAKMQTSDARRNLIVSLTRVGQSEWATGDHERVLNLFQEALGISRSLAEETHTPTDMRDLAGVLFHLAYIEKELGHLSSGASFAREALSIIRELDKQLMASPMRSWLSDILTLSAEIAAAEGDRLLAAPLMREALTLWKVASDSKTNVPNDVRLARASFNAGTLALRCGNVSEAEELLKGALIVSQRVADQQLNSIESRRFLVKVLIGLGDALIEQSSVGEALARYEESLVLSREIFREAPTLEFTFLITIAIDRVADILTQQDRLPEANELYREELVFCRLIGSHARDVNEQIHVSWLLTHIGILERNKGNVDAAESLFREAMDLDQSIALETKTPQARHNLLKSTLYVGDILFERGEYEDAARLFSDGMHEAKELHASHPKHDVLYDFEIRLQCCARAIANSRCNRLK